MAGKRSPALRVTFLLPGAHGLLHFSVPLADRLSPKGGAPPKINPCHALPSAPAGRSSNSAQGGVGFRHNSQCRKNPAPRVLYGCVRVCVEHHPLEVIDEPVAV